MKDTKFYSVLWIVFAAVCLILNLVIELPNYGGFFCLVMSAIYHAAEIIIKEAKDDE